MSSAETSSFRSPISKLLSFFHRSRDQWKAKCKAAKRENKSLKTRLAKMKESRDRWKDEARSLRTSLQTASVEEEPKNRVRRGSGGGSGSRGRPARRARLGIGAAR
jgi:chromosome segregation ATPase